MAKASDNQFPKMLLVPVDPATITPPAGTFALLSDSTDSNKIKRKSSAGTLTTVEGGGSSGTTKEQIVCNRSGVANYTQTATSFSTIDSTNLTATVTTPSGGRRYKVELQARISHTVGTGIAAFDFEIDGTRAVAVAATGSGVRLISITSASTSWEVSISYTTAVLTAGSHTIRPVWRTNVSTLSMLAGTDELVQFTVTEQ